MIFLGGETEAKLRKKIPDIMFILIFLLNIQPELALSCTFFF